MTPIRATARPGRALIDGLLLLAAGLVVLLQEVIWRGGRAALGVVAGWAPLRRLHGRLGALPSWAALPLFLLPELTSRAGFFVSVWLVWVGRARLAAMLYGGTKIFAGLLAIWIYTGCEPALLRVRWFRAAHEGMGRLRAAALARMRARGAAAPGGRFAELRAQLAARLPWNRG